MTNPKPLPVIQSDRDAAWPFRSEAYRSDDERTAIAWNRGTYDHLPLIQAFARHRLSADSTPPSDRTELADELERIANHFAPGAIDRLDLDGAAFTLARAAARLRTPGTYDTGRSDAVEQVIRAVAGTHARSPILSYDEARSAIAALEASSPPSDRSKSDAVREVEAAYFEGWGDGYDAGEAGVGAHIVMRQDWQKSATRAALESGEHTNATPSALPFERMLLDLLAVIHRDGGHRTGDIGIEQSWMEAMMLVPTYLPDATPSEGEA